MNNKPYHLGASSEEQNRLYDQRTLYGDTEKIKFKQSDIVCEIGCGPFSNYWISQLIPNGQYIGIDVSHEHIESAKKKAEELKINNARFMVSDAKKIALPTNSVDVCFARCLLIHLPDPQYVLKEMVRIARPMGKIILIEPHNPTYYVTSDKKNIYKCHKARNDYAYSN